MPLYFLSSRNFCSPCQDSTLLVIVRPKRPGSVRVWCYRYRDELRLFSLPRTRVNKGEKRKGRGCFELLPKRPQVYLRGTRLWTSRWYRSPSYRCRLHVSCHAPPLTGRPDRLHPFLAVCRPSNIRTGLVWATVCLSL